MTARFYHVRLAKGAPFSALKVWKSWPRDPDTGELLIERPSIWRAHLNGEDVPIEEIQIEHDGATDRPSIKGDEISEDDYKLTLARILFAKEHAPHEAEANPRKAVNLLTTPVPW